MTLRRVAAALAASSLALGLPAMGCLVEGDDGLQEDLPKSAPTGDATELAFPGATGELRQGVLLVRPSTPPRIEFEDLGGTWVFEGDILLDRGIVVPFDASGELEAGSSAEGLAGVAEDWRLWPGGVVPYVIDPALPNQARVTDAIAHYAAKTNIKLVERGSEKDYIRFVRGTGCSSYIGRIGGEQKVNLADGCSTGSTIHEIAHALGAWHEQSRADRDGHVLVRWENIQSGKEHNFKTYLDRGFKGVDLGQYDFGSIMHYGPYSFSSNGQPTLVRASDGKTFSVQRAGLSPVDIAGLETLYPASTPPCQPKGCAELGVSCGPAGDGCGGTLDCGGCGEGESCSLGACTGGGGSGACAHDVCLTGGALQDGCSECVSTVCEKDPYCCATAWDAQCVNEAKSYCGACGGGTTCQPKTCADLGAACGPASDGCGGALQCGSCAEGQTCENGACVQGCQPKTCAEAGASCGPVSDGCGGTLDCGGCGAGEACEGGKCSAVCQPKTCADAGYVCGELSDGCGGTLACGTCASGESCSSGQCVSGPTCQPKTCASEGWGCGSGPDGCGGTFTCATCPLLQTCDAATHKCKLGF